MTIANELEAKIRAIVKLRRSEPMDDYRVIAAGLEMDSAMKILFWKDSGRNPFFTLSFSDGSEAIFDVCRSIPETP
jgi:hypothetical protein